MPKFLSLLDENPKGGVDEYLSMVRNEYDSWLNPYKNDDLNQALHEVRKFGQKAEEEFKEIVNVLGDSVVAEEILEKLIEKHHKPYSNEKLTVEELLKTNNMSPEQLMDHFGIKYDAGKYLYKGNHYKHFVDSVIAADNEFSENQL